MPGFEIKDHDLLVSEVHRNLPSSALCEHAIRHDKDASIAENGALVAYSGAKTGCSHRDKMIVKNPDSEKDIWWEKSTCHSTHAPATLCVTVRGTI